VVVIYENDDLHHIKLSKVHPSESAALAHCTSDEDILVLLHHRLGHLNIKSVKYVNNMVSCIESINACLSSSSFFCKVCIEGKQQQLLLNGKAATYATNDQSFGDGAFRSVHTYEDYVYGRCQVLCHIH